MIFPPTQTRAGCEADVGDEEISSLPAEQFAIHYIDGQVAKAQRSLRRTRAFCLVTIILILGYMSVLTITIRNQLLRPQAAAELATYYFSRFASQNGAALSPDFGEQSLKLPPARTTLAAKSVKKTDYLFQKPNPTAQIAAPQVEAEVANYVQGFISHPGNVQDLFHEAQHPKTVQELSAELDQEIRKHLPSQDRNNYPNAEYMSALEQRLETLTQLELQLNRLAQNRDLTPYERALRHVIASTMGNVRLGS